MPFGRPRFTGWSCSVTVLDRLNPANPSCPTDLAYPQQTLCPHVLLPPLFSPGSRSFLRLFFSFLFLALPCVPVPPLPPFQLTLRPHTRLFPGTEKHEEKKRRETQCAQSAFFPDRRCYPRLLPLDGQQTMRASGKKKKSSLLPFAC